MATEKRLIDVDSFKKKPVFDRCSNSDLYDPYCVGYNDALDRVEEFLDATPTVDAVEVSRLGKLGQMMMPYPGCPRGMIGKMGEVGGGKDQSLEILELDPITDIDGNRWVPVLDSDLSALKDKANGAVEVADMREFAEDVVYQFGYYCQNGGQLHITHGGLSTLEYAFDILGWENPHPVPECECEVDGCHEHATCGVPTADGYKRMCGKHCAKMDGDGNG